MSLVKAEGIVIRSMKLGETSKIVTLFTREYGVLKLVAKGSRARKSRFGAALEPLTVARLIYYHREPRDLQLLSQAEIVEHYPRLLQDLERWGYAIACCELVSRSQPAPEARPRLYPILVNTLRAMNQVHAEPRACFWGFQMKLLGILGVAPNVTACLGCRSSLQSGSGEEPHCGHYDVARGGIWCNTCAPAGGHSLSGEALRLLANFQSLPAAKLSRYQVSTPARHEIETFLRAHFRYHLPEIGGLVSLKFVREIKAGGLPPAQGDPAPSG